MNIFTPVKTRSVFNYNLEINYIKQGNSVEILIIVQVHYI